MLQDGLNMIINISFILRQAMWDSKVLTAQIIAAAPVRKPKVIFLSGVILNPRRRRPGYNCVDMMSEKGVRISC